MSGAQGTDSKLSLVHKASASASAAVANAALGSSMGARSSPKDDNPTPCKRRRVMSAADAASKDEKKMVTNYEDFGTGAPDIVGFVAAHIGRDVASIVFQFVVRGKLQQPNLDLACLRNLVNALGGSPREWNERQIALYAPRGPLDLANAVAIMILCTRRHLVVTPSEKKREKSDERTWIVEIRPVKKACKMYGREMIQFCLGCYRVAYCYQRVYKHEWDHVDHANGCIQRKYNAVPAQFQGTPSRFQYEFYLPGTDEINRCCVATAGRRLAHFAHVMAPKAMLDANADANAGTVLW